MAWRWASSRLADRNLELYRRGKTISVRDLDTGRNHRLATLGLADAFKSMSNRFSAVPQTATQKLLPLPSKQASPPTVEHIAKSSPQAIRTTTPKEPPVDLLQIALQGVTSLADALSIAPHSAKAVENETTKVKAAVAKATTVAPSQSSARQPVAAAQPEVSPESEMERIARERLGEIAETRAEQDHQLGDQQTSRLNR